MKNIINNQEKVLIEKNIMFVSTIYDSFEALEETLRKLRLKDAEFLVSLAKKNFANEVVKYAKESNIYINTDNQPKEKRNSLN